MIGEKNTAFQHKKHEGGSIMVRARFAACGPGQCAIIDGTMNSIISFN